MYRALHDFLDQYTRSRRNRNTPYSPYPTSRPALTHEGTPSASQGALLGLSELHSTQEPDEIIEIESRPMASSDIPMSTPGPSRLPETLKYKDLLRSLKEQNTAKYAEYKAIKGDKAAVQAWCAKNLMGVDYSEIKGVPQSCAKFYWFCLRKIWKTTVLAEPKLMRLYMLKCRIGRRRKFKKLRRGIRKFSRRKFKRTFKRYRRRRLYRKYFPRRRYYRRRRY